jgi:lipase
VEGSESENRTYIDLKKAAALMPRGRYVLMKGAGHLIPMEQPAQTTRMVEEFFSAQ